VVSTGPLLTTSQLSKRLGISVRTLQQWRVDGWIKPELVTVGGQARWDEDNVKAQLRELAERQQSED
jgi:predicted site-specific integrase-resolvase